MAIRDRVTVRTASGQEIVITATRAGGEVEFQKNRDWVIVEEHAADARHTTIREAHISTEEVVSIVRDTEPKAAPVRKGSKNARDQ